MPWKTIPDFSDYEISHKAEVRRKTTGRVLSVFLKYRKPHFTPKRDDGVGRNLCIRTLMAELWPEKRGWDRWLPYQDNTAELRKKARKMLKSGASPNAVSHATGLSVGELVYTKNRIGKKTVKAHEQVQADRVSRIMNRERILVPVAVDYLLIDDLLAAVDQTMARRAESNG